MYVVTSVQTANAQSKIFYPPLKAYMEPFLICMKESKGLPLQTTASGSGASVVAVDMATVVVSGSASALGALVILGESG